MIQSISRSVLWSSQIRNNNKKWVSLSVQIPASLIGGGNRVYSQGSGIGSDSSMVAANDRCMATTTTATKVKQSQHNHNNNNNNNNIVSTICNQKKWF